MLKILLTTIIAFIIVIIILLIFITFTNNNIKSTALIKENFVSNYLPIIITNSGSTLTDHQVNFTLNYNSFFSSNFQDLRFFDTDKLTSIPYYIENVVNGTSANVWLKIPSLTSSKTIYISYGNSQSLGNPDNVFELFDDFNSSTLNSNKWDTIGGTPTMENGFVKVPAGSLNGKCHLISKNTMPNNLVADVKMTASGSGIIPELAFRVGDSNNNNGIMCRYDTRGTGDSGMGVFLNNPFSGWPIISHPSPGQAFPVDSTIRRTRTIINGCNIQSYYASNETTASYVLQHSYNFSSTEVKFNTIGKFGFNNHVGGTFNITELKLYKATNNTISINTDAFMYDIASVGDAVATPRPTLDQQYLIDNSSAVHRYVDVLGSNNIAEVNFVPTGMLEYSNLSGYVKVLNSIVVNFSSLINNSNNNPLGLFNRVPNIDSNLASFGLRRYNANGSFKNNIYGTNNINFPRRENLSSSNNFPIVLDAQAGEFIVIRFPQTQSFILSKYAFKAKDINNAPASWKIFGISINATSRTFTSNLIHSGTATREEYVAKNKRIERFLLNNYESYYKYVIVFERLIPSDTTTGEKTLDFGQIYLFKNSVNEATISSTASNNIAQPTIT